MYKGFFGNAYVRKTVTRLVGSHEETIPIFEEITYRIRPSFVSIAIEIQQSNNGLVPQSLRYSPILPYDAPIFGMCESGDVGGVKMALTRGEVPLYAQNQFGQTLLQLACFGGNLELCLILHQLGIDVSHQNDLGDTAFVMFLLNCGRFKDCIEPMVRLTMSDRDDVEEHDILKDLGRYHGPPSGIEYTLLPGIYPAELDWGCLPRQVVVRILKAFSCDTSERIYLVRKIVRQSTDLHRSCEGRSMFGVSDCTLLDMLLHRTKDPIAGAEIAQAWLGILTAEGKNVHRYLEEEKILHKECIFEAGLIKPYTANERLITIDNERLMVEWDRWIDPEAPASLVCKEFKFMDCRLNRLYSGRDWQWVCRRGSPEGPGSWFGWWEPWPFVLAQWDLSKIQFYDSGESLPRTELNLANSRLKRRIDKKALKLARAQGQCRRERMPGSWVD